MKFPRSSRILALNPRTSRNRPASALLVSICAFFVLVHSLAAAPAPPAVRVEKIPATIERRTFDPKNPPAEMPALKAHEAALCEFKFGCDTRLGFEFPRLSLKTSTATITACEITIRLSITVWTPTQASAALIAHEETHREICELYYASVENVARPLAQAVIGRKLTVPNTQREEAIDAAVRAVQAELMKTFLAHTAERCTDAQERFDLITDHSRNPIANADALARAVAEESARPFPALPR